MNFEILLIFFIEFCRLSSSLNNYQTLEPKRYTVYPQNLVDIATSSIQAIVRLGSGGFVSGYSISIEKDEKSKYGVFKGLGLRIQESSDVSITSRTKGLKPLELYEFEGCPFCRKVREAVNILDLDVIYYPCPRGGPVYRAKVIKIGGKAQFPYFVDPNTQTSMYESDDIIKYLFNQYGNGEIPSSLSPNILTTLTCGLAMLPRVGKGSKFEESKKPQLPLTLWAYEVSPFCKVVRERLVELEIPFLYKTVARGSPKRQELYERKGLFQAPYLEDPNTGVELFESIDIINYINKEYAYEAANSDLESQ